jgi:tetratricopeptide (TPR) repeat protein
MLPSSWRLPVAAAALALGLAGGAFAAPADDLRDAQKLYSQGKLQPAMEKVDAYLKAQPREPQGRFLKGLLLTEQKKVAEAIQVFTSLTEDYPELPEPYNNLAVLYASQGNYDKAKSALELAIHTHPSYATAHENLGDIYAQLASRAYDRALQLDKTNTTAQVKLALVKDLFSSQKAAGAARPDAPKLAKAEPPKSEPPKAEPAKVETTKAAPPKATEAAKAPAPATKPAVETDEKAAVQAAVEAWARAWASRDVAAYLAAYAADFETPGGEPRAAWEKQRSDRISAAKSIQVNVTMKSVTVEGNEATAVFRQSYRSDKLKSDNTKTLKMVKVGGKWLIKQERVRG